ncbi:basic proline-rich protein-like [Melozone crissalis]|uniref:basic proline-rich protein-like n=1 Tax=Melozone crissalis TaxID=40204 RepID=UPI0023DB69E7|nr:basic proline-rich protein-like [Melozone crissalis]
MRRAASAAPPPGPMGPLPPRPTATPAGRPRSAAQRAPGSAPRHYRGASPAGVPLPAPGTPPGVPAPRLSASTSLCSGSPPRGSVRIPLLEVSAPRLLPGVPAPRFSASSCAGLCPADPLWVPPRVLSLALPLRGSARSSLARLRGSARTLPAAHSVSRPLLLGSLHAPAIPGASRPGWPLRSPRARPGSQRGGAALPPGLPARSPPPGPARPPPQPCEHALPPGTPRPGTAAGRGRDGTDRNGKERCSRASSHPRSFPPSETESPWHRSVPSPALCAAQEQSAVPPQGAGK